MSILNDAEDEAQQALVQLDRSHRTLREACAKQHYVKMSRQYYWSSTRPTTRPRAQYSKENGPASNVTCLSCGGNHRKSQCPKKPASHSTAATAEVQESAPFICYRPRREQRTTQLMAWWPRVKQWSKERPLIGEPLALLAQCGQWKKWWSSMPSALATTAFATWVERTARRLASGIQVLTNAFLLRGWKFRLVASQASSRYIPWTKAKARFFSQLRPLGHEVR